MKPRAWVGVTLIKIASVYLAAALGLGLFMAISKDYSLVPVHSHIGLLGWASMAIAGIVYVVLPRCEATKLAGVHFWLHNVGLPIAMGGLSVESLAGSARAEPVIGAGSTLMTVGLMVFVVNVFKNARAADILTTAQPSIES